MSEQSADSPIIDAGNVPIHTGATGIPEQDWSLKYNGLSIHDDVEYVEWYQPGEFYPLDLGETINDRFEVIHKLGHGGVATVWLCWDLQTKRWRALKINSAGHSSPDCPDMKFIKHIGGQSPGSGQLGRDHIMLPLETFFLASPNGTHLYSALPVAGPKLTDWRRVLENDFNRVKHISYQLVEGLAFLHSRGICHGDFRPDNVLMKLKPGCLDHIGPEEMRALLGEAIREPVLTGDGDRTPHAPRYCYIPFNFLACPRMISDDIAIVDFGETYEADNPPPPPETLNIPVQYVGPEYLFAGVHLA